MRVPFAGFVGGAYEARSSKASTQQLVNWYVEQNPEKGAVLIGTPGLRLARALGSLTSDQRVLGMMATPNGLIFATENNVLKATGVTYDADGNATLDGVVLLDTFGPSQYVVMAQAGDVFMIVNGASGAWGLTSGSTLVAITDPDFPANPKSCTAVDGYFLVHSATGDQIFFSENAFDPASWNALDSFAAENTNDALQRLITVEREVYAVGTFSTEVFVNVGGDAVFDRIAGTFIPHGTPAHESVAGIGQTILFLAQDLTGGRFVAQVRGMQMTRVSTHAIEHQLAKYTTVDDAYALAYMQEGHPFYCLTFPTHKKTWVYDLSTSLWHERSSPNPGTEDDFRTETHWSPRCHAYFQGANLVGGRFNPILAARIYQLRLNNYQDENAPILRKRVSPHVMNNNELGSVDCLELLFEPGTGNEAGFTSEEIDPKVSLRVSRDGGKTWGNIREAPIGRQGKYKTRTRFNRLGRGRDFVFEVSVSAPVKADCSAAYLELS